jgi:N-acetyldiaminopimelate deacetylase
MKAIELRHKLHMNPETALKEYETTTLLEEEIKKFPGILIHRPFETGLIAEYKVNDGKYLLFRGDIDALNMTEKTDWEFASRNGNMHACGHDVHTSTLFGFLEEVVECKPDQNILFFFQPAEEGAGGAELTIQTGIFDQFDIEHAFALHVTDEYAFGTLAFNDDVLFASAMELTVLFNGKPTHVATPEKGKNALNAMRTFLDMAEKVPHSINEPLLLCVGKVSAGEVRNIIPETARIEGSIRSLDMENSRRYFKQLKQIGQSIEASTGVSVEVRMEAFYPEVKNDHALFEKMITPLSERFNTEIIPYKMTGEDFGFFTKLYPSMMLWLGTAQGEKHGLHSPYFLPSDEAIPLGIDVFTEILKQFI